MSDQPNDKWETIALVERLKANEPDGWRELLLLYGPLVDWWIAGSNLPKPDRDDIFQNVFVAVAEGIPRFGEEGKANSLRGWLRIITRSRVVDHFRRNWRTWPAKGGDAALTEILDVPADSLTQPGTPEIADNKKAIELQRLLAPALAIAKSKVNERTWLAFWASTVDDRPTADIAQELGITPSAVRLAKSRVLGRLRDLLEE